MRVEYRDPVTPYRIRICVCLLGRGDKQSHYIAYKRWQDHRGAAPGAGMTQLWEVEGASDCFHDVDTSDDPRRLAIREHMTECREATP